MGEEVRAAYGYNPTRAKALLKEAGYPPGMKLKLLAFVNPGESEGPQVADALGIYFKDVGIEAEIEVIDWARIRDMFRNKNIQCCIWPNIISWRPVEDWIRVAYYSKGRTITLRTSSSTSTTSPSPRRSTPRAAAPGQGDWRPSL